MEFKFKEAVQEAAQDSYIEHISSESAIKEAKEKG